MAFLCGKSVKSPDGMRYLRTSEKPQIHPNSSKFIQIHLAENLNTMKYYEITMKRGRAVDDVQLPTHLWRICSWAGTSRPSAQRWVSPLLALVAPDIQKISVLWKWEI
jgi:hypothetical protein